MGNRQFFSIRNFLIEVGWEKFLNVDKLVFYIKQLDDYPKMTFIV